MPVNNPSVDKREDDPHVSADTGFMALSVRNGSVAGPSTTFAGTDGDYSPIAVDNFGALQISAFNTAAGQSSVIGSDANYAQNMLFVGGIDDSSQACAMNFDFAGTGQGRLKVMTNNGTTSGSDTYVATGNGTAQGLNYAVTKFTLMVKQTGTVTAWDVRLEGSLDNINYTQLIQHTNADLTGTLKFTSDKPVTYVRTRCAGLTLGVGTNVVAVYIAV